ncbi:hydroxymethylglutaryl-CoA lyase YngG [Lysinibacillus alkalisoli]|uniref:Hydroxymethylglutaryl-CoA lyase YngG n=1 Tax=Lysinibacillus alkalisoli TaxID=1911548 RepID=A0A917FXS4_9BACI|nr:hydroxymethylglutaryl-CoA lyase [Lysinibacillus alkalisoli]GGG12046.1 hydroxymethylglutaryl-CoA lyase YngG [Lysinibacillus alkalisoli]
MKLPKKVVIKEVGPRDGLQNEKVQIETSDKVSFINLLSDTGLSYIEVTSFVHPKWIPQLSDAFEVMQQIKRQQDVTYAALIPNMQGLERALQVGIDEANVFMSASESHNKNNINKTIVDTYPVLNEVVRHAKQQQLTVRGYVSTVLGCPYEGDVSPQQVLDVVHRLFDMGVDEISLGDTIGVGVPNEVERLLEVLLKSYKPHQFAMHFHDTRGTAIANIIKSMEMGITIFDSAVGGLGGCPYAKGASGNVATEDVLYTLNKMGITTNVSLERLLQAAQYIEHKINRTVNSKQMAILRGED